MKKLKGILSLIRYKNILMTIGIQLLVCYRFIPKSTLLENISIILGTALIVSGGNMINDYYDLEIDKINKPSKTLFTSIFSPTTFLTLYFTLSILAILLGIMSSFKLALFFSGIIIVLWLYSWILKKKILIGNFTVALLSGLTLLSVGIYYNQYHPILWLFTVFSFMMTLVRELIKDIEDIEGDLQGGCLTFPVLHGISKSKILLYFYLLLINLLLVYFLINQPFEWIFFSWGIIILGYSITITSLIHQTKEHKDFRKISSFCKKMMLIGTIGIIFT